MRSPRSRVEAGGLGIEDDLAHRRVISAWASPRQARISATWPSVVDRSPPVSMTKSARARFSASGIWRARIGIKLGGRHARSCKHARALHIGRCGHHDHLVECLLACVSNSNGMSNSSAGASRLSRTNRVRAACTAGWTIASSAASCLRSPEHMRGKRFAIELAGHDRLREALADRCDQLRILGLQAGELPQSASNTGTPACSNIRATVDLPMPIEPVSASIIMTAAASGREARRAAAISGIPRMVKWSPRDRREKLHAAPLHPEHADAIADLRPFGIEIAGDELLAQRPHLQVGRFDVPPVDRAALRKSNRAGQPHRLAGEKAQMLRGLLAVARLVEQPIADADDAVAADHPTCGCVSLTASAFAPASSSAIPRQWSSLRFTIASSTSGRTTRCSTPAASASAGGSGFRRRGSGPIEQPCGKRACRPSADLGACSTETIRAMPPIHCSTIYPRG